MRISASVTGYRARWRSYYSNFVRKSISIRPYGDNHQPVYARWHWSRTTTIRSYPGDNTGHSMTGHRSGHRSMVPGTGPVTGPWYRSPGTGPCHRSGHWFMAPVTGDRSGHRSSINSDRSNHRSIPPVTRDYWSPVTGQY
ncbi:hypothetical protein DPMN_063533 [Dreissena polymorpha]|uniref:Uncharacterized protein n=1 Tax=Dreissena polymorpha TaxID=45954 RepID=A0A9D4CBL9_DREPO|nr:hypothetical protein DPMN_063533 [Dreissena polymorpha]